jgi:membrane protease YdiL (CAAX protease family)
MTPSTSAGQSRNRTVPFAADHPVAAFLIIVFVIAYPVMGLIALAAHRMIPGAAVLTRLPIPADEVAGLLLTLGALLPAAVFVTWTADGRPGVLTLLHRIARWRFSLLWWSLVVTSLPLLTVGLGLLLGDAPRPVDPLSLLRRQLPLLLTNLLLVNLWEETAWAGVLQTRLEQRHNLFLAAALTAIPFGFAHWPLAWLEPTATTTSVLLALPAYLLLGLLVRPLFGLTLRGTGNSLLAVALTHSVLNRTQNPNGVAAQVLDGHLYQLGVLVALLALTGLLTVGLRHKLSRSYRDHLDGVEYHQLRMPRPDREPEPRLQRAR